MLYDRRDFGLLCLAGAYQWLPLASNLSAQQAGNYIKLRSSTLKPLIVVQGLNDTIQAKHCILDMENSDAWNCLSEIEHNKDLVQSIAEVIIKNTSNANERQDFWEKAELNLLMALMHYVASQTVPGTKELLPIQQRSLGAIYRMLSNESFADLERRFEGHVSQEGLLILGRVEQFDFCLWRIKIHLFTFSLRIDQNVDCFLGFLRHSQVHFFVIGHGFHLTAHYSQYIRHSQEIDYDKVIVGEKNDKLPPLL